ncbi:MAG TPA: hypothetical protein VEK57_31570 [Thermoanaerobaculia bacterium]|nr:hypothetical protein [Thermoanaerobaculia bacterium]
MSASRSARFFILAALVLVWAVPSFADVVKIDEGISFDLPADWLVLPKRYRNVVDLVPGPPSKDDVHPARVQVWVERRRSHEESVRRLGEIAAEWKGELQYAAVEGWPAVLRRYDFPIPRRGRTPETLRRSRRASPSPSRMERA